MITEICEMCGGIISCDKQPFRYLLNIPICTCNIGKQIIDIEKTDDKMESCKFWNCKYPAIKKGLCKKHYKVIY